jgi:putative PIN family toxin of toxin-antitoxin system
VRIVLDTNAVVQATLTPHGPAGVIVGLIQMRSLMMLVDERILQEYDVVLERPEFDFRRSDVQKFMERIRRISSSVQAHGIPGGAKEFPDPDDVAFLEVAVAGNAEALVTMNLRHFPERLRCGIMVVTPVDFVRRFVHIGMA